MQRLKRKLQETQIYMPGINGWALQKAAMRKNRPLQNSMDGTCVIRAIELYSDKYLIGEEFPADVQSYPEESNLPIFEDAEQTTKYICKVRMNCKYAAEAYSIDFVHTTGKLPDLIGSIPESKTGVLNAHIFGLNMMIEKKSMHIIYH